MYRMLAGDQSGALPYWFRKKRGVASEVTFASAQALLLVNETLSVMSVVHAGLDLLALPAAANVRTGVGQKIKNSEAAIALLGGNRHPLHAIVIVNLATALESGIKDTFIVALRFVPHFVQKLRESGIDCGACIDDRDLSYDEARALFSELEKWKQAQLKKLPREQRRPPLGWLIMLDAVGLSVDLSEADCVALREMVYIRNCIVHRAGRADADAVREMRSGPEANRLIRVRREDMGRFATAAIALASGISKAALKRDFEIDASS